MRERLPRECLERLAVEDESVPETDVAAVVAAEVVAEAADEATDE